MNWEMFGVLAFCAMAMLAMFIRLEHRLTAIETHITWLKREVSKCLPTLEVDSE